MKGKATEYQLCQSFFLTFEYLLKCNQFSKKLYLFHVPNEQGRNTINYTKKLKGIGLKAGVADYGILIEGGGIAFIEFKRHSKCVISDAQKAFGLTCASLGIPYLLTWQPDEAIEWLKKL